jgi:hypothetical protein
VKLYITKENIMKYNKEYLDEQFLFSLPASVAAALGGAASDVLGTFLRPPLDLAKSIGREQRGSTIKRAGMQKFGSQQGELERAIEAALGKDKDNLLGKLGERGRQLYQTAGLGALIRGSRR